MAIISLDPRAPDPTTIERAAAVLRAGGLVAFPTETVYGLGAHALDAAAVLRIYAAKGRPSFNPLIVHVANEAAARALAMEWPDAAAKIARAFWPGPVTIVVRKRDIVPDAVTGSPGGARPHSRGCDTHRRAKRQSIDRAFADERATRGALVRRSCRPRARRR
jgi:tRNA A37 threonylcarbamoyladenosine synthetase subunit TsaC/SUA5/YrdC